MIFITKAISLYHYTPLPITRIFIPKESSFFMFYMRNEPNFNPSVITKMRRQESFLTLGRETPLQAGPHPLLRMGIGKKFKYAERTQFM